MLGERARLHEQVQAGLLVLQREPELPESAPEERRVLRHREHEIGQIAGLAVRILETTVSSTTSDTALSKPSRTSARLIASTSALASNATRTRSVVRSSEPPSRCLIFSQKLGSRRTTSPRSVTCTCPTSLIPAPSAGTRGPPPRKLRSGKLAVTRSPHGRRPNGSSVRAKPARSLPPPPPSPLLSLHHLPSPSIPPFRRVFGRPNPARYPTE